MPKVQSYRKSAGSGALQPVRAGTDMSLASQEAVMRSGLPDGTAARAQRDMSMAGVQRGRQAAELMAAGAKLSKMGGDETARVAYMSGRAERLAMQSSAQILTAMGSRFVKMQEDHDAAEVMEAANEWHEYVNQYFNDPEKGMKATRQLANAKGLYDDTSKYLEVVTERCAQNLRTPQQKQAFLKSVAGSRLSAEEKASVYEAQEMGKYAKQTTQQTVQSAIASVAEDPTPTNFNANFERARDAVLFYMRGADEESQRIAVEGLRSDFHAGIITNRMQTDPITAEKYFEQVKGEILPEARVKLEQDVRNAALEAHLQQDTPLLFEEYGFDGLADARAYIRDNYSGDEEEKRISAAESYWREQWSDRKFREEKSADDILGMMDAGASLKAVNDAISAVDWTSNGARRALERERDEHFRIGDFAPGGKGFRIDWDAVLEVDELRKNGKILEVCPTINDFKDKYGARVGSDILKEFRKYYNELNKGASDVEVKMDINYSGIFKKKLEEAKIKDPGEQGRWMRIYTNYFDAMKNDPNKKGPITPDLAIGLMDTILAPEVVGTTKNWLGNTVERRVRRGYIPPGAEQVGGSWYIRDADGRYHELFFPDGSGVDIDGPAEVSPQGFDGIPMGTISAPVPDEAEIWRR